VAPGPRLTTGLLNLGHERCLPRLPPSKRSCPSRWIVDRNIHPLGRGAEEPPPAAMPCSSADRRRPEGSSPIKNAHRPPFFPHRRGAASSTTGAMCSAGVMPLRHSCER
jgi:hypothetical protein